MILKHAWFSSTTALRIGSSIYRKSSGSVVNVTRVDEKSDSKGAHHCHDEKYLGEVIVDDQEGSVRTRHRVGGITPG